MEQNFSKVCDKCNGVPHVWGEKEGFFGTVPFLASVCDKCTLGIMKPKEIIHHLDRAEPTVIY